MNSGQQITLNVPLKKNKYLRTFSAEIDILTENTILVRGQMRDHRFALEHVWTLRTPDYEVLTAGATQLAGNENNFAPELCQRYQAINGVRVGRGFSKRILTALGDLPGTREHLFLAIEMARVGQQVYQFPPGFAAQFSAVAVTKTEAAKTSWLQDRAYMPDLVNSCYAYRDETAELFSQREINCSFDSSLTRPKPGEQNFFWRHKKLSISAQANGGHICQSSMEDRIHDIQVEFELSHEGIISNAESRGLRLPYHGICEDPHLRTAQLNGQQITSNFSRQFAAQVGGSGGCTHIFDLATDCLKLFKFGE